LEILEQLSHWQLFWSHTALWNILNKWLIRNTSILYHFYANSVADGNITEKLKDEIV
jgi:hypothetical protein